MRLLAPFTGKRHTEIVPRVANPAGSDEAREPVAAFGSLVKASILRFLRAEGDVTIGVICSALNLAATTVGSHLRDLEEAGLVSTSAPAGQPRNGTWVRYRVNDGAVTELYLRLGAAIGEI